jgi:hypothetical protein
MMNRENILLVVLILFCLFGPKVSLSEPEGFLNPSVTKDNLDTTVCVPRYTSTIRPQASYTNKLKKQQMKELKLDGTVKDYEEDHFVPLALGGHPTDPRNLWPEPWEGKWGAHTKDKLETRLHRLLCTGGINLKQAQTCIKKDWKDCYVKVFGEQPTGSFDTTETTVQ